MPYPVPLESLISKIGTRRAGRAVMIFSVFYKQYGLGTDRSEQKPTVNNLCRQANKRPPKAVLRMRGDRARRPCSKVPRSGAGLKSLYARLFLSREEKRVREIILHLRQARVRTPGLLSLRPLAAALRIEPTFQSQGSRTPPWKKPC